MKKHKSIAVGLYEGNTIFSWSERETFHEAIEFSVPREEKRTFQGGVMHEKQRRGENYRIGKKIKLIFFRPLSIQSIEKVNTDKRP